MLDWKWRLSDLNQDKDVSVFTTFSCGGGSTMGYKRAGFRVIGNVELDPRINSMYVANHHPEHNFLMDLREFNRIPDANLPQELFQLDILDGSPPCSTFSTAGLREKAWGKRKAFREGQAVQALDDLPFIFLETVGKLRPKMAIAENVSGLIKGNAKGYVNLIIKGFRELGYSVQLFLLNSAYMDVPQRRERLFFVTNRMGWPKLELDFHGKLVMFGEVRSEKGAPVNLNSQDYALLQKALLSDKHLGQITKRLYGKENLFTHVIVHDWDVANTLTANSRFYRGCDKMFFSNEDFRNVSTFPQDYNFCGQNAQYVCGMSVPPNMMAHMALEVWRQWLQGENRAWPKIHGRGGQEVRRALRGRGDVSLERDGKKMGFAEALDAEE